VRAPPCELRRTPRALRVGKGLRADSLTNEGFIYKIAAMSRIQLSQNIEKNGSSRTKSTKPRYAAPALDKGLAILEFLATDGKRHTQTEIAQHLGRSQSEIFRMLACLEERGYVQRGPNDEKYCLTSKLFELAHAHPPTRRLIDLALPVMRSFAENSNQSCHLVVHRSYRAVVIAQVDGPGFVGVFVRPGTGLDLHESVSGRVLAAFEPSEQLDQWQRQIRRRLLPRQYAELSTAIKRIHKQRYEMRPSKVIDGILDMSVPIMDHQGYAIAVLSVPCLISDRRKDAARKVLTALQQAASAISQAIGAEAGTMAFKESG